MDEYRPFILDPAHHDGIAVPVLLPAVLLAGNSTGCENDNGPSFFPIEWPKSIPRL